ncbi:unnamed protein product [Paramecium octaurelia]|uniref:Uncharacterized protein n=1 Tax=Paramecium octaurelia TaxID=43137 RepID=A0A8S1SMH0_PAROT|nr:unnamed protein product [Paramecium octaurelia]
MIIKYNERRVSITPKTQTSLNSPVRNNTQPVFLTSPKKQLSSIKEITNKQQELNKLLNQHVDFQTQSANTSMHSFDCITAQSKFRRKQVNADISSKLMHLDDEIVEVYNEFEKNYRQVNDLDKLEYTPQASQQQIFVSRKSLNNLIQTHDGLMQSDLKFGNLNRIRINRFKFYYFRIKLRGKVSPIQVFFNIPERVQSAAVKMFLSTKAEFPTKFNAEYILHSRFAKIFSERNQHYFTEEYLFITIYSDVDFEFSITFQFGNTQITKSPPKQIVESLDLISQNCSPTQKQFPNDKILQNLSLTQYHGSQKLHKILSVQSERTHKQKLAKSLRQSMLEDKKLEKKSKLLVKEQILHFREVERQIKLKKLQMQFAQQNWFQLFSLLLITEYVSTSLQEQKRRQKVAAKGKLLVWAMKTKALLDVKEYGESAKERTIFKTRCVVQSFACMIRHKSKIKAEFVVTKFMGRILLFLTILNKHQSTLNKVIFIQRKFRILKAKKRKFRDKFWKLIKENIADIIYDLRRQKETQFFFDKQQINIDIPAMNIVIDDYCKKQRVLWLEYIQHTFLEKDQKRKIHEYAKNLKEPKIYDLPNKNELIPLIEQYAKMKKIL